MKKRRVVVTGFGIISSIGTNIDEFWKNCLLGHSKVEKIPEHWFNYADFNSNIWSPLPEVDFSKYEITRIEQKQLDKTSLLTIASTFQALDSAGLEYSKIDEKRKLYRINSIDVEQTGVFIGTGIGGVSTLGLCFSHQILNKQKKRLEEYFNSINKNLNKDEKDSFFEIMDDFLVPHRFNPFAVSMIMSNASSSNISIRFGLKGVNNTYNASCASGTIAIGNAFKAIREALIDCAITGGVEYMYDEYGALFYAFDTIKTLVNSERDIKKAYKPFDKTRTGFLYSQGGSAILILEELGHALDRGANIYAEILGYSENSDGYNIMMLEPSGSSIKKMIAGLLKETGVKKENVDYINTHGTGTVLNDEVESRAIEEIFGNKVLLNSTKSLVGHTLGASGAIEALATALSIKNKTTHICKNLEEPLRDLNFVREVKEYPIKTAITQSFGFGGHNACLLMKEFSDI